MLSVCTDSEISSKSYTSTTDVQNFIKCLNGEKLLAYINSRAILTEITAQRFAPLYHQVVLEITGHCKRFLETIIQGGLTKIGKKIASCIPICEQSAHPHSYSNAADFDLPDSIPLSSNSNSVIALNSRAYEWGCYPISNLDPSSGQFHYKLADEVEIFVEPELLYTDYMTHQSYTTNIDDLTQPQLRYIIVAPPGHGKTRLQREMAIRAQHQIHTFINAVDFANSGIRDIYGFSARMIADIWQIPPQNLLSIRNELEIRDQTNEIFWHIDDWDLVPRHQRGDMAISLSPLKSFSVTTVYPDDVASFFPYSSTDPQLVVFHGAVHIQPLNNTQCEKLLSIYYDIYNENIDIKKTLALVEKLPGFSQSVPGMRHLIQCAGDNEMNSLAITEGFIWGQPLSSAREIIRWSFDLWERTPKNLPPDLSTNDELFDLNPDDVIAKMRYQSRPDIPSIVNQWFSGFLAKWRDYQVEVEHRNRLKG